MSYATNWLMPAFGTVHALSCVTRKYFQFPAHYQGQHVIPAGFNLVLDYRSKTHTQSREIGKAKKERNNHSTESPETEQKPKNTPKITLASSWDI